MRAECTLQLLSGCTLEMVTQPQVCRGRPIGRVWAFRDRTELVKADRRIEDADHHRCPDRPAQPPPPG